MKQTYVFQYGRAGGYKVEEGTEFIVRCPVLDDGREVIVEERRRVSGDSYGFGSAESFEEVAAE
jgi:hypothetical protein